MSKSFEKIYASKNADFSYDKEILLTILSYLKRGKILDLGCGEGGLILALAKKGYVATGVEISRTATTRINEEAKKSGLAAKAECYDLEEYQIDDSYDAILALGIFHLLPHSKVTELVKKMQKHTNPGGINVIDAFVQYTPHRKQFLPEELEKTYSQWEILKNEIYLESKDKMVYLVARNPE